ncbi:MAG TPA: phosphatase [Candidatus Faecalibacterium intestinipullorum]|nr:phosphatase [Candidatus Faecalibacterium intestinipullorum]
MRKPYLIAVVAMLAAVAGALAAVAVYLRRREQELDEYERLLFGEDDALEAEPAEDAAEEAAPAEEPAE